MIGNYLFVNGYMTWVLTRSEGVFRTSSFPAQNRPLSATNSWIKHCLRIITINFVFRFFSQTFWANHLARSIRISTSLSKKTGEGRVAASVATLLMQQLLTDYRHADKSQFLVRLHCRCGWWPYDDRSVRRRPAEITALPGIRASGVCVFVFVCGRLDRPSLCAVCYVGCIYLRELARWGSWWNYIIASVCVFGTLCEDIIISWSVLNLLQRGWTDEIPVIWWFTEMTTL